MEDACPVCASQRYAFLSTWLPSDERRRWRRPAPKRTGTSQSSLDAVRRFFSRWFGDGDPEPGYRGLKTRAADFVPDLSFEEAPKDPPKQPVHAREPIKNNR